MLGAVVYGHEQMQAVINMINELAAEVGKDAWDWMPPEADTALIEQAECAGRQRYQCSLPRSNPRDAVLPSWMKSRAACWLN